MTANCARKIAIASGTAAVVSLIPVVLRQTGVIEHLPDPAGEVWDSDGIVMSKAAHPMGVPDGVLGIASYAATIALLADGRCVARAKLVCDASAAGFNVVRQVVKFGRLCSWCMAAAVFTVPMVVFGWKAASGHGWNDKL